MLEVLAGVDEGDPYSRSGQQQCDRFTLPKIGIPSERQMQFFGDEAAAGCWRRAVLQARGVGVDRNRLDPVSARGRITLLGPVRGGALRLGWLICGLEARQAIWILPCAILSSGAAKYSAVDVFNAEYQLQDLRSAVTRIFEGIDALLLPTAPSIYRIEEVRRNPIQLNSRLGIYTNFVNLLDLCAIAVPAGLRDDGLPFGVTLMAPAFSDAKLLRLAHWWEGSQPGNYLQQATGIQLAVVGAHLAGQPLNHQLTVAAHRCCEPPRPRQSTAFSHWPTPRRQNRACSAWRSRSQTESKWRCGNSPKRPSARSSPGSRRPWALATSNWQTAPS